MRISLAAAFSAVVLSACASQGDPLRALDPWHSQYSTASTGMAHVLSATPIYSDAHRRTRIEVCANPNEVGEHTGLLYGLVGGVFGGLLGSQFGAGTGKVATAAVGAVSGAAGGYVVGAEQPEQVGCHPDVEYRDDRDVVAWEVTYTYSSETYHARLPYRPSQDLKVNVAVTPIN